MESFLFTVFAVTACGGAVAVVLSQHVVRMAFWLVISLGSTAGLFFLLNADFVGAAQLLIYVGGTVVLLIFGVMLTASGPYLKISGSPGELLQASVVGLAFLSILIFSVLRIDWDEHFAKLEQAAGPSFFERPTYRPASEGATVRGLGAALLGTRFDRDLGTGDDELSTGYLLPFEIISVHLLVVLVGAAYLARAKRKVTRSEE
ncbi:MAG: NADH-quinone oxidoreductase subunit J [Maioricimonas sp. JB045]|uniref:NADH-quinone oxidoreductase subunit J family protein n=1 Tax=Maioricimonas sp. JC845 TaxID=3232138 RepID=UPI003457A234